MSERDFAGARKPIKEAMEQNNHDIGAVTLLAQTYDAQHQPAAAIPEVRAYAAQEPLSAQIQTFLGKLLMKNGDRPGAMKVFLAALKTDSHYAPALIEVARVEMEEGKLEQASGRMTSALVSNPKYVDAYLLLGAIEERRANYTNAVFAYRKALSLDEKNRMALNNLAFILADSGNQPDEALSLAQRAVELSPNEPEVRDTLGWVYYQKGMYSQAVKELQAAASKSSAAGPKFHLGLAYLRSGDAQRGQRLISEAVAADPLLANSPSLQAALRRAR
jgi:Tfp pilus assembly protein PilF